MEFLKDGSTLSCLKHEYVLREIIVNENVAFLPILVKSLENQKYSVQYVIYL